MQFLSGALAACMHVDGSRWCSTTITMTGACSPLSRKREVVSARSPKPLRQGSIPWLPAHVILASRMANAGRKPKRSWVKVPETTPSQRPVDLDDGFISRTGCGSSPPAATKISRCSEVVSRAVRDRETGGSIPLTSTHAPTGLHWAASQLVGAPWGTVHLGVIAVLQTARGRCNPDVPYDFRL